MKRHHTLFSFVAIAMAFAQGAEAQLPPPPQTLYGLEGLPSDHWIREPEALGEPIDTRCTGSPRDWAANDGSPAGQILIFNCEPVQLGPHDVVTDVWVDALARYADDLNGPIELEVRVPFHIDQNTPRLRRLRSCVSNSPAGNCRWRFNSSGSPDGTSIYTDIVNMYGQSFPWELVHTLDLLVRGVNPNCSTNDSNLQLKAVRMVVATITDCNGNGIHDPDENGYKDDNNNGCWDVCDAGYADCNSNGCWDQFEPEYQDLNGNGRWDICDPGYEDCNNNGSWDDFEPDYSDLNNNGRWDICDPGYVDCDNDNLWDIFEPDYADCNDNNRHDGCDITADPSLDCDSNGTIDSCQIEADSSLDLDGNGVLDSCEYAGTPYCLDTAIPNSSGEHALLVAIGTDSIAADNLDLWCGRMPPGANGYFLVSQAAGIVPMAGGSMGTLCISGPGLGRYADFVFQATADGLTTFGVDPTMIPQPMGPVSAIPGQTWNFQCWYRDEVNMMATSNHSNAVRVTFNL